MDFYTSHLLHQQRLRFESNTIRVTEKFVADPTSRSLTEKFYSKYKDEKLSPEQHDQFEQYKEQVTHTLMDGPRDKYCEPVLESHMYGWLPSQLFTYHHDERDCRRFFRGRPRTTFRIAPTI